jgi:HEAT repeat protein
MIPSQPYERSGDSYLSPHVRRLNVYLRAFSYTGEAAIPYLRQAAEEAADPEVRKWLTVARGMAGDGDVAPDIERIIRGDPDMSTRAEAARAYARSAKEAAIRLLVELLDDPAELPSPTVSPLVPRIPGERPVATVAASELTKLGHHDLVLSHRQSAGSQGTQTAPGG